MTQPAPLILTLDLDPASFAALDALRRAHFPSARNFIPAHVTLFHALPGEREAEVRAHLTDVCGDIPPLALSFPHLRFLGRGVAVEVRSPPLLALRARLAERWRPWLTRQDQQPWRPHVTIQNKVPPEEARALFEGLSVGWSLTSGQAQGVRPWRYLGGPWEALEPIPFSGPTAD